MNASVTGNEHAFDYSVEFRQSYSSRAKAPQSKAKNRPFGKRKGSAPKLYNGIHRRRRKSIQW